MKKIFCLISLSVLFAAVDAQAVEVYNKDETVLNFGIKGQVWAQTVEDAAPSGSDWSKDFSVKQLRLYANGSILKWLKFGVDDDYNNYGQVDGSKGSADNTLTDAFLNFEFAPAFQVNAGKYRAAFSRLALTDSYTAYLFPHAPFAADPNLVAAGGAYRMIGVTGWGMIGSMFRYNVGLADGTPSALSSVSTGTTTLFPSENDSRDSLQYLFRVEFTPVGEDRSYVHVNEWLGKKPLVTFGAGYTTKRYDLLTGAPVDNVTYKAWTADVYAEFPLPADSAIAGEAAYYDYDKDTPVDPKSKAWYVQAAFTLPGTLGPGRLQPAARYEKIKRDGTDRDTTSWAGGVNYYLKEHNAKVMLEYLDVNNQANANTFSGKAGQSRKAVTLVFSFGI